MITKEERRRCFWWGVIIVGLATIIACIGVCAWHAAVFDVNADKPADLPVVEITYTDEETDCHAPAALAMTPFYPLTMDERDYYAALVAGKAADQPAGCQQAVAPVLYHTLLDCDGDMRKAAHDYCWGDVQTPTEDTYDAIDAVFVRGELLLDADVLWIGRAGQADAFHSELEEVCTIGGITFYREGK